MSRTGLLTALLSIAVATPLFGLSGATLQGSPASMVRQNEVARSQDYTFLRTGGQVARFVEEGYLVPVSSGGPLRINGGVSYPVARPEMKLFLERLAVQYQEGCGEQLVVTSLVRPTSEQPRNSHPLSVHPAGMAADLRVSSSGSCREWLESTLLALESRGLLDVTRERHPPHYHVALFPDRYFAYVQPMLAADSARAAREAREQAALLALASVEHVASPLVATATPAGPEPTGDRRDVALLLGVAVVFGALGTRRLLVRRSAD